MTSSPSPSHVPVFVDRCLALLAPALERPNAVVVDATLGLGGHSEALLQRFPDVRLVGIDRDESALALSAERLAPFASRTVLVHAVFDELPEVLEAAGLPRIDGILFDLGVRLCSSIRRNVGSRTHTTHPWTCGWIVPPV